MHKIDKQLVLSGANTWWGAGAGSRKSNASRNSDKVFIASNTVGSVGSAGEEGRYF